MEIDRQKRYETADAFFELCGSVVMRLSTNAAIAVCREATVREISVSRIEGGIWHNPGFEARVDCIWDSSTETTNTQAVHSNNLAAIEFIISEQLEHDTFIITASPLRKAK